MNHNKVIVTMPTRGLVLTEVQDAIDREMITNQLIPTILRSHDLPLPVSRNYLVESALKIDDWEYMLMMDDDVVLPKGALKAMLKVDKDVVVMDYPITMKADGKGVGTIVRSKDKSIAYAGLGSTLVKRKVFETIPSPWFVLSQYRVKRADNGELGFYAGQPDGEAMQFSAGEDTYFYLQCQKHGLSIGETKLTATHVKIDQMVTKTHRTRYAHQHVMSKYNKIEMEAI